MKPTRLQLFFAKYNPFFIMLVFSTIIGGIYPIALTWPYVSLSWLLFLVPLCALLGFFTGLILATFILPFVSRIQEKYNGGPFKIGDSVMILKPPLVGIISMVYDHGQGLSLRVDISKHQKKPYDDYFCPGELLKSEITESPNVRTGELVQVK